MGNPKGKEGMKTRQNGIVNEKKDEIKDEGKEEERSTRFSSQGEGHCIITSKRNGMIDDLKNIDFQYDDELLNKANEIFGKMGRPTRRVHKRVLLLWYVVYQAHRELKREFNIEELMGHFGINKNDGLKALSQFSRIQTGYRPPREIYTAANFIPSYCKNFNLDETTINNFVLKSEQLYKKDPSLRDAPPRTMALGIIHYCLKINGIILEDENTLSNISKISRNAIDNASIKISQIDNN